MNYNKEDTYILTMKNKKVKVRITEIYGAKTGFGMVEEIESKKEHCVLFEKLKLAK